MVDGFGFGWAFAVAALPLLGVPFGLTLGRRVDGTPSASATDAEDEPHLTDLDTVRMVLRPTVVLFVVTMAGGAVMTFAPQLGFDGWWAAAALLVLGLSSALVALAGRAAPPTAAAPRASSCRCCCSAPPASASARWRWCATSPGCCWPARSCSASPTAPSRTSPC